MNIEGPLMSLGAHGTIANAITFSMRGGHARAGIHRTHRDARTQTQLNQRAHYLDATRLWKLMTNADKLEWTRAHQLPDASGYNVFLQTIINRITRTRHWQHPVFFSPDKTIPNFLLVQLMENYVGSTFQDISGNQRDWSPTNTTQEQGSRGEAALQTGATTNTVVANSSLLGDMTALTLAVRTWSSTPQGNLGATVRILGGYGYGSHTGFILAYTTTQILLRIGDTVADYDIIANSLYTPGMWNNLVATFDAGDSGRGRIILNGAVIANQTTAATKVATTTADVYLGRVAAGTPFPGYIDNVIIYNGVANALRI